MRCSKLALTCVAWLACAWLSLALTSQTAVAADPPTAVKDFQKAPRGRLPAFYREVVDDKQREAIYAIQQQYAEKIEQLKAELATATQQRDTKIAAVLSPEQIKKVADLDAAAKAKRANGKPAKPAPAATETTARP